MPAPAPAKYHHSVLFLGGDDYGAGVNAGGIQWFFPSWTEDVFETAVDSRLYTLASKPFRLQEP